MSAQVVAIGGAGEQLEFDNMPVRQWKISLQSTKGHPVPGPPRERYVTGRWAGRVVGMDISELWERLGPDKANISPTGEAERVLRIAVDEVWLDG